MNNNRMPLYSIIAPNPLASPDQSLDGLSDQRNKLISRLLFQGGNNNNDNGNWNSPIKFSRLISPDSPTSSAEQVDQQAAKSDLVNNTGGQQEQQLVEQAAISVATRSPHGGNVAGIRGSVSSLGAKNYISALLLGRASTPSQISSFGPFIKKAEPKDNIFMHFGRKWDVVAKWTGGAVVDWGTFYLHIQYDSLPLTFTCRQDLIPSIGRDSFGELTIHNYAPGRDDSTTSVL